jgi:hypothetical protein
MTTMTAAHRAPPEPAFLRMAALTTVAALVTNLIVFGGARAAGISFKFSQPRSTARIETVSAGAVLAVTLLAMTAGWILVGLAAWRHRPALGTIAILAGSVAVVSALAPLALEADLTARLTLASLHLATGAFFMLGISRLRRAGIRRIR